MSLKIESGFPEGNVRRIAVRMNADMPEICFAADPQGGPECLWFYFRLVETGPEQAPFSKIRLTLKHFDNMRGAHDPSSCRPVHKPCGKDWFHMRPGKTGIAPDGQHHVSWEIDYPAPSTEIAFSFPYGTRDVRNLVGKTRGYWNSDSIGLSQAGRPIHRLSNHYGEVGGDRPGIYIVARERAGETPGSWVLDGLLREFARAKDQRSILWAIPLLNIDGIARGDYGRGDHPGNLSRSWGGHPARHETLVAQNDIRRWSNRCAPALAIDFQAQGACETAGVFCYLPDDKPHPKLHRQSLAWANTLTTAIPDKYVAGKPNRPEHRPGFLSHICEEYGISALTLTAPYTLAGDNLLSRKCYREIGKAVAGAIVNRLK